MTLSIRKCDICQVEISGEMARVSMNNYRKWLCIECQVEHIKKNNKPEIAKMMIDSLSKYRH